MRISWFAVVVLAFSLSAVHATEPTKVVRVSPPDKATSVNVQALVQIHFSDGLKLTTITANSVRLLDAGGNLIAAKLSSDIEGDVVNLQPAKRLLPRGSYTIEVNGKLIDKSGAGVVPFRSSFTTGDDAPPVIPKDGFQYTKTKVDDEHGPTAIAAGPDGNIYVSTYIGILYRLRVDAKTGLAMGKDVLLTLPGRRILGLTFDPEATAGDLIAWITYDDRKAEQVDAGTFSGVVSKVVIPRSAVASRLTESAKETPYIIGLPSGWHPLNGGAFGPDKRLYVSVGSMSRLGGDPLRPERPLLRLQHGRHCGHRPTAYPR